MISEDLYNDLVVICVFAEGVREHASADAKLLHLKAMAEATLQSCTPEAAERFVLAAGHVARMVMLEQGLTEEAAKQLSTKFSSALQPIARRIDELLHE